PYYGSLKGSESTLLQGAGNDLDQASLLIGLLRSGDVPSRYVLGTVEISRQDAARWLDVADGEAVLDVFSDNGIPAQKRGSDIRFEHYWVRAYIDDEWVDLDPSYYLRERSSFEDTINYTFEGRNLTRLNYTVEPESEVLNLSGFTELPTGLPYDYSIIEEYSEVPASERHSLTIRVMDDAETLLEYRDSVPTLSESVVAVRFENTSETNELGEMYGPWEVPSGLYTHTPALIVNGEVVDSSSRSKRAGEAYRLQLELSSPWYSSTVNATLISGSDTVVVLDAGKTARAQVARMFKGIGNMSDGGLNATQQDTLLSFLGLYFFELLDFFYDDIGRDYLSNWWRPIPACTVLSREIYIRFGPALINDPGFSMDFVSDVVSISTMREQNFSLDAKFMVNREMVGISGILESILFEHFFNDSIGLSSHTLDEIAASQEMEQVVLTSVNIDTLPGMMLPSMFSSQIEDAVEVGLDAKIYTHAIQVGGQFFLVMTLSHWGTGDGVNVIFHSHSTFGCILIEWIKVGLRPGARIGSWAGRQIKAGADWVVRQAKAFGQLVSETWDDFKDLVRDVANAIKNIVMAAYTKIKEIINGLINQLKKLPDLIKEAANWTGILDT
ncbi:MAG: transglutaminase domain-containing protein, partial [Thermoplasmata archaeon]|nr:transglutaminase domain-containing protein [Thermoplasmata archaeon]